MISKENMAHITDLGFTLSELRAAVDNGDVRVQWHPEFPELAIYNYTEEVQYRNKWNKITLACRGLILNEATGEIVARPWEKFFNFGQMDNRIESTAPVEVTDKMDGSLGILYRRPDGVFAIATRGSFASEQAIHATNLLNTLYEDYRPDWLADFWIEENTYLFEIIYPENRIVVDYGDQDDLVLLGAVSKKYGVYYGPQAAGAQIAWPGPLTESWNYEHFVDAISFPDRKGKEGVVIRSGNKMVKLKQADYVELHRIVTNLSPKTIWEMLKDGKTVGDICAGIPDEFHSYVTQNANSIFKQANEIKYNATIDFLWCITKSGGAQGMPQETVRSRKEFAKYAQQTKYPGLVFAILDGKDIDDKIWDMVKPRGDTKTLVKDEG